MNTRFVYCDETGDDGKNTLSSDIFVLTSMYMPSESWNENYKRIKDLRKDWKDQYGLHVTEEMHTAGAEYTGKENHQTEPPHGIESEQLTEDEEGTRHAAYSRRMGGYFPPHVDQGTDHLYKQGSREDRTHKMGDMYQIHQIDTEEVAEDGNDVGHHPSLLESKLHQIPPLIAAIEVDEHRGQQDSKYIDEGEHLKLIGPRHQRQVAE